MRHTLIALALAASWPVAVHAAGWNEAVDGDLSDSGLAPSSLLLGAGSNPVRGAFGAPDRDYLRVLVPDGFQLSALRYGAGNVLGGVRSFIGVQSGAQMTVLPDTESAAGLLGWTHYQEVAVGTDLLPAIGQGFGATGFVGTLPAGSYTFWIQDTSAEPQLAFSFDLVLSAVPEPGSGCLMLGGAAWWLRRRRSA